MGEKLWNRVETNIVVMKDAIMQRLYLERSFVTAFHCVSWVTFRYLKRGVEDDKFKCLLIC